MKSLILLIFIILLTSCSGFISKMHREFDRSAGAPPQKKHDKFDHLRGSRSQKLKPRNVVNSQSVPFVNPAVKRHYQSKQNNKKRYKADDLADNSSGMSLWTKNSNKNNFLFADDKSIDIGDIILINVMGKLKNEITSELKSAFPAPRKKKQKADTPQAGAQAGPAPASQTATNDQEVNTSDGKVYDRVSSVIAEKISDDHYLLRGRKYVLYRNKKRMIEIQALVSQKDLQDDDTVLSDKIIESYINVLR